MKSGDGENDPEVDFFLLSDACAEDKELRMHLQLSKLEHVLAVQEKERNNAEFKRACFFCRMEFEGSHSKLLDHMAFDHNFRFVKDAYTVFPHIVSAPLCTVTFGLMYCDL